MLKCKNKNKTNKLRIMNNKYQVNLDNPYKKYIILELKIIIKNAFIHIIV